MKKKKWKQPCKKKKWCSGDLEGKKRMRAELDLNSHPPPSSPILIWTCRLTKAVYSSGVCGEKVLYVTCTQARVFYIYGYLYACGTLAVRPIINMRPRSRCAPSSRRPPPRPCWDTPTVRADVLSRCAWIIRLQAEEGCWIRGGGGGEAHLMFISSLNGAVQASRIPLSNMQHHF